MIFNTGKHAQPSDDKRRVLDATDIVRLVGEHVALKQRGREYLGLCPFHDDHSPSMNVVPHKQIYHCFSCGAGGDALAFMMNYHKMAFREALEHLAERAGITLTPWRPAHAHRSDDAGGSDGPPSPEFGRAALVGANQTASTFFRAILKHPEHGAAARELIARRAISPEMVELFGLGAAPDKWDGLHQTIVGKSLDPAPFRAAGLLKARDSGSGLYDAFRNRLTFPIHDQIGAVIAFGGRRINDEDEPKYLNSSESSIFNKSTTLYGLHQAAQEIRRTRRAIVCEGYMDAIACHQGGLTSAVATLGTALTAGNARILTRLCDRVVLLFDGDEAGMKAAERAVEVFFAEPIDVRIAILAGHTDAKDPDELLKRDGGRTVLDRVIESAIDPMELLFAKVRRIVEGGGGGLSARSRAIDDFLARLTELGLARVDKIRQQLIIKRVGQIAGVEWETVVAALNDRRLSRRARAGSDVPPPAAPAPLTAAEHLLGCVLCEPTLIHSLTEEQSPLLEPDAYAPGPMQETARAVASLIVDEHPPSLHEVLSVLDDPEAQRAATRLAAEVERFTESDKERLHAHWRDRLRAAALEAQARRPAPNSDPARDDLLTNVALIREARGRFGHDPRVMPTTGSG